MAGERPVRDPDYIADSFGGDEPAEEQGSYIGVPDTYVAERTTKTYGERYVGPSGSNDVTVQRTPKFFKGAEWEFASRPPEERARVQRAMLQAGVFKPGEKFRLGAWDDTTRNAYKRLLAFANAGGYDNWAEALAEWERSGDVYEVDDTGRGAGSGGTARQPKVINLTNPEDIKSVVDSLAVKRLGRRLSDADKARYAQLYNQLETEEQNKAYDLDETGGTMTNAPGVESFIDQRVKQENPGEYMAHETVQRYEEFLQLLGSD